MKSINGNVGSNAPSEVDRICSLTMVSLVWNLKHYIRYMDILRCKYTLHHIFKVKIGWSIMMRINLLGKANPASVHQNSNSNSNSRNKNRRSYVFCYSSETPILWRTLTSHRVFLDRPRHEITSHWTMLQIRIIHHQRLTIKFYWS